MKPQVSVIIPVWNRVELVKRSLDSILHQTLKPSELIVVDNNSIDNTYRSVEEWMNRHIEEGIRFQLLREPRQGACAARQKGLESSNGEYIIFFDSDDVMLPHLIEKAVKEAENFPEADVVCWKCRLNLLNGRHYIPPFNPGNALENHLIHSLLRTQGYMVKKSFLEEAGGWRKPVAVWNDFELGLRLLLHDPKIQGINDVMAEIYSQKDSITGPTFSSKEGEWESTLKEMEKEVMKSEHPAKNRIKKILNYRRAILGAQYYRERNQRGAERLISETLIDKSFSEKTILQFAYNYTRMGLRGAWRFVRYAYK